MNLKLINEVEQNAAACANPYEVAQLATTNTGKDAGSHYYHLYLVWMLLQRSNTPSDNLFVQVTNALLAAKLEHGEEKAHSPMQNLFWCGVVSMCWCRSRDAEKQSFVAFMERWSGLANKRLFTLVAGVVAE